MVPLLAWLALLTWGIFQARAWLEQRTWEPVTARVESVEYKIGGHDRASPSCSTGDDRGPCVVLLTYSYDVGGKPYASSAYNHRFNSELFCEEGPARARVEELKKSGQLGVWIDPQDPQRAVQQRQSGSEAVFMLFLIGIAGLVLLVVWLGQRKRYAAYEASIHGSDDW